MVEERSAKLEELRKIKAEIDDLLVQKAEIVRTINEPIYQAKAKAEEILKSAKTEAEATISASNKILAEAQATHEFAHDSLRTAKGELEKVANEKKKLEQDKIDFDGLKFAHENTVRQHRNSLSNIETQNRQETEVLQQSLIEVKQREEAITRRENGVKTAENELSKQNTTLNERKSNLEALQAKLGLLEKTLADSKADLEFREKVLIGIREQADLTMNKNLAIQADLADRKTDLTRQQNDLARQIEILDNSKAEMEEKAKSLKEQEKLIEIKKRQNDEKLARLEELRKNV